MATTINTSTLTYSVTEQITLNGVTFDAVNTNTISGIGNYVNNIFNVVTGTQAIIAIAQTGVAPRDAEYDVDNLKYIRLTNADDTNEITVVLNYVTSGAQSIRVAPLGSLIITDFALASSSDTINRISITASADVDVPYAIGLTS